MTAMPSYPKILGVVTARGGSKRLPRKNIRPLAGKPLLGWTIEAALDAKLLSKVILSTDDNDIAEVGRSFGIEVPFIRPSELAEDGSHHPPVLIHALAHMRDVLGETYDAVMVLQPTVPFRTADHIDGAIEAYTGSGNTCLISVKAQDYPPWWMFRLEDGGIKPAFEFKAGLNPFSLVRQDFPTLYRPNGAIYITSSEALEQHRLLIFPESCSYFLMNSEASINIDTLTDFQLAEAALATRPRD